MAEDETRQTERSTWLFACFYGAATSVVAISAAVAVTLVTIRVSGDATKVLLAVVAVVGALGSFVGGSLLDRAVNVAVYRRRTTTRDC